MRGSANEIEHHPAADEFRLVTTLKARLRSKRNVEVVRRGLRLLQQTTDGQAGVRHAMRVGRFQPRSKTSIISSTRGSIERLRIERGGLYAADLNPRRGTAPGKVRPVVAVVQSDLLNEVGHPSTVALPCSTRVLGESLLRVHPPRGIGGNPAECEIMVDQARALDDGQIEKRWGSFPIRACARCRRGCASSSICDPPTHAALPSSRELPKGLHARRSVDRPEASR
jgi:mRNA interferase MazF